MGDKTPFYALDLRNISGLVKTKTKTRAMPNGQYWVFKVSRLVTPYPVLGQVLKLFRTEANQIVYPV